MIDIIATPGPSTHSLEDMRAFSQAGANIFRLNLSHGTLEWHRQCIENIRQACSGSIMFDTKGPEIRIGKMEKEIEVSTGDTFILSHDDNDKEGENIFIPVDYPSLTSVVEVDDEIIIDSGNILCEVKEIYENGVLVFVNRGGTLSSFRHVNIPRKHIDLPILTEKDKELLHLAQEYSIEYVAASFVRNKEDIDELRQFFVEQNYKGKLIAKVENQEALDNIDDILQYSDGIMIARGDLGVEIPWYAIGMEEIALLKKAKQAKKYVIVATQMLTSMIHNTQPTRAEVMDITIAAQMGASAVMLSDETAIGEHPIEAIQILKIVADYAARG